MEEPPPEILELWSITAGSPLCRKEVVAHHEIVVLPSSEGRCIK